MKYRLKPKRPWNKGIVLEHWDHKIYWVVQEPVYQNLVDRYNLHNMEYHEQDRIVFLIYDLAHNGDGYELVRTRIESSNTERLFDAFKNNPNIPSIDDFIHKLKSKLKAGMELKLQLHAG